VSTEVKRLGKGETNSHGRYNYASIDDFLSLTGPLCAKHGLVVIQDEESCEVLDKWLRMRFAFTLAHTSGEALPEKLHRSILVSANMGPQAFGAAQSYVLKQFLRSLFQIPTGDGEDLDAEKPAPLPKLSPRDGLPAADPHEVAQWVQSVKDILDSDVDEYEHAANIRTIHEQLKGRADIYVAIADELAKQKICSKAEWRNYIKLERPSE
jgi:hypothetical protein